MSQLVLRSMFDGVVNMKWEFLWPCVPMPWRLRWLLSWSFWVCRESCNFCKRGSLCLSRWRDLWSVSRELFWSVYEELWFLVLLKALCVLIVELALSWPVASLCSSWWFIGSAGLCLVCQVSDWNRYRRWSHEDVWYCDYLALEVRAYWDTVMRFGGTIAYEIVAMVTHRWGVEGSLLVWGLIVLRVCKCVEPTVVGRWDDVKRMEVERRNPENSIANIGIN